ncbi:MAG: tRNA (guanosine(37)-N1)-methyltransferase TrmD [Candidatus Omnitrophica bacterium]|nr:tRNA (guanosine(37)-N1)-methyltransferase TrmD [Candidatus Omnitrophota bacterium]
MKIDILTLFPRMFDNILDESMLKIAQKKKKVTIKTHNLRDWTSDTHKTADDRPYGGGSGMVMKIEPICKALSTLLGKKRIREFAGKASTPKGISVILLTPSGKRFTQKTARKLSKLKHMILICGHYEGIDERVRLFVTEELSIGDYIMTGGEIPAMVIVDSVTRLIPGVLGDKRSLSRESFDDNLLEYPQYTRPKDFDGLKVPEVLLSGNHKAIDEWRKSESLKKTREIRGDLFRRTTKVK